ncbi:MAG: hypothetical protein RMJ33_06320 [Saprospiraceae bacterium]|nr:hypothetical protein [Saprospiraceae bacterium]MDW8229435.1 hypothetical protein [Saprospiraceae bacterium]
MLKPLKTPILLGLAFLFSYAPSLAQPQKKPPSQQRLTTYWSSGGDGGILSLATVEMNGREVRPALRWSPVFNFGSNFNWDFANGAGVFLGWNIRNIGLITKDSVGKEDYFKRRIYMLGLPLGIKLGNMRNGQFFYFGGEFGLPFNYKEKYFPDGNRRKKTKFNEWFSERVPQFTTAAFAGFHFRRSLNVKVQYFFNNFFNPNFTTKNAQGVETQPYRNYQANVFFLTLGFDFANKRASNGEDQLRRNRPPQGQRSTGP